MDQQMLDLRIIDRVMNEGKETTTRNQEPQENHSVVVETTGVDIKSGLKFMRVLGVILYVLSGIAVIASVFIADKYHADALPLVVLGGCLVPVSIGLLLRKAADIAEYISDKVK